MADSKRVEERGDLGAAERFRAVVVLAADDEAAQAKGPNLGLPFGYYGKFNTIKREIEKRPGMKIVRVAMHRDLTLEDFWITVGRPDGSEVKLAFVNANIRSRADLRRELEHLVKP